MSLSVMPAWKRLDLVGKMWWIILNWKAINFESLVIKKATRTLCGYFLLWNRDLVFCSLMLRCCLEGLQEEHFGASCFDLCFLPFCRNGSDEAIVQYWCTLVFTLRVSSSTERMVLSSFKNCLIRVIWALNKGLKKEEEGLCGARYRPSCNMHTTLWLLVLCSQAFSPFVSGRKNKRVSFQRNFGAASVGWGVLQDNLALSTGLIMWIEL